MLLPRTTMVLALGLTISFAAQASPFAYVVDGDTTPGNFYRIDLADNTITLLGQVNTGADVEASSFGPGGTTLYVFADGDDTLYTVDISTGNATSVGPLGVDVNDPGMAFCPDDGIMYLVSEEGDLYSLNLTNGAGTLIGSGGPYGPTALACTATGTLYAVSDADDQLYTVDRTTGAATVVGPLGVDISDAGLGLNGGTLLLVTDDLPTNLYQVNIGTGAATVLAVLDAGELSLESMAVDEEAAGGPITPTSIPTLSTWGMIFMSSLLALLALFKLRRRAA